MPDSPDPELVCRLEESAERLFRFCLHLTGGHRADAEDLTQETLVSGFRALPGFLRRAQLTTYLYTIATHAWRRQAKRPDSGALAWNEADSPTHDPTPDHLHRLRLYEAIDTLPAPLREAFVLVKVQQLTHREAAEILGVPTGTVQSRVHEAIRHLRKALSEDVLK
ncbi:MAG: RNA polymerase sigma factor [Armatimonas sp.]